MDFQSREQYDFMVKIVMVGDEKVGKTQIGRRLKDLPFQEKYKPTIGVEFRLRTLKINNDLVKFQVWDTAGQEKYRIQNRACYTCAAAAIIVFSFQDYKSFENVEKYCSEINDENQANHIIKVLVGNKIDIQREGKHSLQMAAEQLANKNNMSYLEVCAKTGENIDKLFYIVGEQICKDIVHE